MKVAVVTPQMASGERGGAEALYRGLVGALRNAGHDTDEVPVYTDESCFDAVLESYARCYALDLRAYDLVISTKAPTFMVSHPNHVSYLLHTLRVFYDMFETEYGAGSELQQAQRRTVYALDRFGLQAGPRAAAFRQRTHDIPPPLRRIGMVEVDRVPRAAPSAALSRISSARARRTTSSCRAACTDGNVSISSSTPTST